MIQSHHRLNRFLLQPASDWTIAALMFPFITSYISSSWPIDWNIAVFFSCCVFLFWSTLHLSSFLLYPPQASLLLILSSIFALSLPDPSLLWALMLPHHWMLCGVMIVVSVSDIPRAWTGSASERQKLMTLQPRGIFGIIHIDRHRFLSIIADVLLLGAADFCSSWHRGPEALMWIKIILSSFLKNRWLKVHVHRLQTSWTPTNHCFFWGRMQ